MPVIVIFGFFLTIFVFISFFGLCLYICFQCYNQGFPEGEQRGSGNGETATTTTATTTTMDPEERNRQTQMAMEKLTKPSAEYDYEENDESPSTLSEWINQTCPICRTQL
ncbi:unnamed protein product [Citrullus colocynthis]|uniref:Uncharacterized protein n=1 Tax=Citrullus colocynthis TaxID=252529 RepID=A0ABP0YN50_9ROSI